MPEKILKPSILAISGVSTGGKTYIAELLPEPIFYMAISHTTRINRSHEFNGLDYYFVSQEEFNSISFIETTTFVGNSYGLSTKEINNTSGRILAHVCDLNGMSALFDNYDHCFKVFIDIHPHDIARRMLSRWMDNSKEDLAYLSERIHYALTYELDQNITPHVYIKDKSEFDAKLNIIVSACKASPLPKPVLVIRNTPFQGITADCIHQFLLSHPRPKRGELFNTISDQLISLIEKHRV